MNEEEDKKKTKTCWSSDYTKLFKKEEEVYSATENVSTEIPRRSLMLQSTNQPTILLQLQEKGVALNDIIDAALALYTPCRDVDNKKTTDEIREKLEKMIIRQCQDINVSTLVKSAIYLDDELKKGNLKINGDPVNVLSDELIGMAIAEYIGGKKALFNYVRYDAKKPGIIGKLDVFLDDAISGLIAGCMSRVFEDWI
jgi:alpha-ribazole phosphatase CobZ